MNLLEMAVLARTIDDAQVYFMAVAKNHDGEITITFKNEVPYVTVFLGKGSTAEIGFGNSVAGAMANAISEGE